MAARRAPRQSQRDDTIFLRSVGSLALASSALERILSSAANPEEKWRTAAERLLADSARVMAAANESAYPDDVVVRRRGAVVPVSVTYLDRLTEQIHRLALIGAAVAAEPDLHSATDAEGDADHHPAR